MVYILVVNIDGACRNNGRVGFVPIAGAGVFVDQIPRLNRQMALQDHARHGGMRETNQRAELLGVLLALEVARQRRGEMYRSPYFILKIMTDSRYVIGCMTEWRHKWENNGWINVAGEPVANQEMIQDCLEEIADFEQGGGSVNFEFIPRGKNEEADRLANLACDEAREVY